MKTVTCRFCLKHKPLAEFTRTSRTKSGYTQPCRVCNALFTAIRRLLKRSSYRNLLTLNNDPALMKCIRCDATKALEHFPVRKSARNGRRQPCNACAVLQQKDRVKAEKAIDLERYLAKKRAQSTAWVGLNEQKRRNINAAYAKNHPEQVAAKLARRRARVANATLVDSVDRLAVFERDKWVCQLCHGRVPKTAKFPHPQSASIDHVIPLSQGGEESYRNCVLAHFGCNARKQARVVSQQMRLLS